MPGARPSSGLGPPVARRSGGCRARPRCRPAHPGRVPVRRHRSRYRPMRMPRSVRQAPAHLLGDGTEAAVAMQAPRRRGGADQQRHQVDAEQRLDDQQVDRWGVRAGPATRPRRPSSRYCVEGVELVEGEPGGQSPSHRQLRVVEVRHHGRLFGNSRGHEEVGVPEGEHCVGQPTRRVVEDVGTSAAPRSRSAFASRHHDTAAP